jgi:hypothetical protein
MQPVPATSPYAQITVRLPDRYTQNQADRLRAQFPGIHVILSCPGFSMEVERDSDAPPSNLKEVFAWIEVNL